MAGLDGRMPFADHLGELRLRLRNSVFAILAATIITWFFRGELFALAARPLMIAWKSVPAEAHLPAPELVFTNPMEGFMVLFKLALLAAIFLASPFIFQQIWKFISPGLYPRERRLALPFILTAVMLFLGGGAFAYLYVLPAGYEYFLGYATDSMGLIKNVMGHQVDFQLTEAFKIKPMITMDAYFGLTTKLLLVFGATFELPLVLSVLSMLGVVTPGSLWRFNRYAIMIAFVAGAVLTPGDLVVGQMAMGASLTVLYNISILFSWLVARRRKKSAAEAEAAVAGGAG